MACCNLNKLVKLYMCKRRGRWRPVGEEGNEKVKVWRVRAERKKHRKRDGRVKKEHR